MNSPPSPASRAQLRPALKPRHIAMISFGGIIGAGLFVGSSVGIAGTGPAIVLSYLLAGVIVLLVMRMLAEMAVARPQVRSFTEFTRAALGNGAGFIAGWLYWYFWVIVIPVEAIAGAVLLQTWLPWPPWLIGTGLMVLMVAVNLMPAQAYGEFEFWFASIKVAALFVFLMVGASYAFGLVPPHTMTVGNLWSHGFAPYGAAPILAGVVTAFFSMNGAEIATIAAAESREPARAVAQLTHSILWRLLLFFVGSIFLIVAILPWNEVHPGVSPFTQVLERMHVPAAGRVMQVIVLIAVLSCLNSAFYICSRVLFILAAHGDAPNQLVELNAHGVPTRSVLIGGVAGLLGILAHALSSATVFVFLVNSSGAVILITYLMTAVAQIVSRRQRERGGEAGPPVRMWGFPWLSYATVAAMCLALLAMAFMPALRTQLYVSLLTVAAVSAAYAIRRRCK